MDFLAEVLAGFVVVMIMILIVAGNLFWQSRSKDSQRVKPLNMVIGIFIGLLVLAPILLFYSNLSYTLIAAFYTLGIIILGAGFALYLFLDQEVKI
jgi:hypothetical protein